MILTESGRPIRTKRQAHFDTLTTQTQKIWSDQLLKSLGIDRDNPILYGPRGEVVRGNKFTWCETPFSGDTVFIVERP